MRLASAFLLLSAMAASAQQTESITVNASALVGVWKITSPSYIVKRGIFSGIEFGPLSSRFCRIEQMKDELTSYCLNGGRNTVSLNGRSIHFARGIMIARAVLDGTLDSSTSFTGRMAMKLAGITTEDSNLSSGGKLDLSRPQTGPADALMRRALTDGLAQIPHDARLKDPPVLESGLGEIQALIWLGQQDQGGGPNQQTMKDYFSVYAVEFDHGERLCGLHQRGDGILDAFQCT
jgi:hypothetical protein